MLDNGQEGGVGVAVIADGGGLGAVVAEALLGGPRALDWMRQEGGSLPLSVLLHSLMS